MILTHEFQRKGKKFHHHLLDDVNSIKEFDKRIQSLPSVIYSAKPLYLNVWTEDKIRGDAFEWFGEAFIKILGKDNRIGLIDYQPVPAYKDVGGDGTAIGMNGLLAWVQWKYKSDHTRLLTVNDDHLNNLRANGYFAGVPLSTKSTDSNLTVITTGKGLHNYSSEVMLQNTVRCIGWEDLVNLLREHNIFWNEFRKIVF